VIQTSIQLVDKMTAPMHNMISAANTLCSAFGDIEGASSKAFDMSKVNQAKAQIAAASQQMEEVSGAADSAAGAQQRMNSSASAGSGVIGDLAKKAAGLIATYASFQGIKSVLGVSDELTSTQARLDQMNAQLGGTDLKIKDIYSVAQNARGSLGDMASVVARFGNNAKDAFSSTDEVVKFASIVQKQMTIAGASTEEASNAELQLSQALGSGVLRGDELNSIFEQAPNLIQSIADYMNVPIGQIRSMASEGKLSSDVVKQAILASADEVDAKFNQMPMTWAQVGQSIKNTAEMAFQPVLDKVNQLANSPAFQNFVNNAMGALTKVASVTLDIMNGIANVGNWISENWSTIEPIVIGIVGALGLYAAAMLTINIINGISAALETVKAASQMMATGATLAETAAQYGLNAALAACPITWIIVAIIAVIAAIFAVCGAIAQLTGVANSGFGVICGGINVVIQFFVNLGLAVANIAVGIWNAMSAVAQNIVIAFHNAIGKVQAFFLNLASTAATVVANIANALNKLPFVNIDTSGLTSAAASFKSRAAEAGTAEEYKSISAAFSKGMSTNNAFSKGWASSAFKSGASFGDGAAKKVKGAFSSKGLSSLGSKSLGLANNAKSGSSNLANNAAKTAGNTGKTAGNTGKIAKSVNASKDDLDFIRKMADRRAINRFTTAQIKVQMTNNNKVSSTMDLDGMVDYLANGVQQAMEASAEGAY
jgi:tape measure domain-containing protein